MYSKVIFVLATVCVVNASVITDNIFDDDAETEVKASPSRCNPKVCDWMCRKLKKTSGTCIESHCKCEKSLIAEDDAETEVKAIPSRCNPKVCDWLCRKIKKTSGTCIESHCKCEKSLIAEDDAETEVKAIPSRCNSKVCDWLCRKLNKTNGTCVDGHCKCEKSLTAEDADDMIDPAEILSPGDCNFRACEQQSRILGFPGGACVNGRCKCDNFLNTIEDSSDTGVSSRKCTHQECNTLCRKLKFREGVCIAGRCSCNNYFPSPNNAMNELDKSVSLDDIFFSTDEDIVDEYSEFDTRRTCKINKCNRKCTRRGYEGATCVEGRCKCYKNPEKSLPVSELSDDQRERSCNLQACDQLCRRLKFPGGVCVNGRCKCDNFLGTADTYPVNDATSDENEESNEISNEEELIASSLSVCNAATCNQWCRRLKYAGGWCRFGQCQCF